MRLWHWLRTKLDARKFEREVAVVAAKVAVEEIAKATAPKGQWE